VIAEHRNTSWADSGDPTQHPELVAATDAWRVLGIDGMNQATLYASTEPCSMCAGASYWNGIGRVVYGMSIGCFVCCRSASKFCCISGRGRRICQGLDVSGVVSTADNGVEQQWNATIRTPRGVGRLFDSLKLWA
jgi:tRNA(Arg) A34 adenosine deaminase TadA